MAPTKKSTEQITMQITGLDPRVQAIIDEVFADFEKFLPSIQDVKVYERKRREYWEKISARLKEEAVISDGRADDNSTAAGNN